MEQDATDMIGNQHLWGESWDIYRDRSVWVVGFKGKKGGASALHYHKHMANVFFVSSGRLLLRMQYDPVKDGDALWGSRLASGECDNVYAACHHVMEFEEDTEGIETYYALPGHEIDEKDIVRLSPGRAPSAVVHA